VSGAARYTICRAASPAAENYIEFTSPEECAAGAVRLIEDSTLRWQIMQNNAAY